MTHGKIAGEACRLECNFSWKKIQRKLDTIEVGHALCVTASGIACSVLLASQLTGNVLSLVLGHVSSLSEPELLGVWLSTQGIDSRIL